jgi:hypothetical protein
MARHAACMAKMRNTDNLLPGKSERKKPLGKTEYGGDSCGSECEAMTSNCEYRNWKSGFIKKKEFLD